MLNRISLVYFELEFYLCNKVANGAMLLLLLARRCRRAEVAVIGCGFGCPAPCFICSRCDGRSQPDKAKGQSYWFCWSFLFPHRCPHLLSSSDRACMIRTS